MFDFDNFDRSAKKYKSVDTIVVYENIDIETHRGVELYQYLLAIFGRC